MLVVDLFPGWLLAQGRFGLPAARTDPTQGVAEKADSRRVMPAQFCRETKQLVEGAVQSAQQHCYLRRKQICPWPRQWLKRAVLARGRRPMQREVGWGHPDSSECRPQLIAGGYRAGTVWVNIATLASRFLLPSMVFSSRRLPSLTDFLSDEVWL